MPRDFKPGKLIPPSKEDMERVARETREEHEIAYAKELKRYREDPAWFKQIEGFRNTMRVIIGKTDDISVPLCQHMQIAAKELARRGAKCCRRCQKPLDKAPDSEYIDDYSLFEHPDCPQPICTECAEKNPDAFYLAYKRALDIYHSL